MKPMAQETDILKEMGDFTRGLIKGTENLLHIDQIDVGTAEKELVYSEDKVNVYHYKPLAEKTSNTPVLIIYALVNRYYMLDIQPDRSLVRNLLKLGLDLYIIDWGYPTRADMYLTLDDYINGYINNSVDFIRRTTGHDKINLMGICQGGTFSAIYSALYPDKIKNLVTLVAPFDFSTNKGLLFSWSKYWNVDALTDTYGVIPGDFLNQGFLMLAPFQLNIRKYIELLDIMEDKEKLLNFLRMEKWIFDSPGQAGEAFRQFLKDLYQDNKLVKGELVVGDKKVDLKNITMPVLNIYASADHLVPPDTTRPLNDLVGSTDKSLYEFKGGHIGVFVGSKSQKELAPNLANWLRDRDA
jgi:polyhydroxyalkanoate synthase